MEFWERARPWCGSSRALPLSCCNPMSPDPASPDDSTFCLKPSTFLSHRNSHLHCITPPHPGALGQGRGFPIAVDVFTSCICMTPACSCGCRACAVRAQESGLGNVPWGCICARSGSLTSAPSPRDPADSFARRPPQPLVHGRPWTTCQFQFLANEYALCWEHHVTETEAMQ